MTSENISVIEEIKEELLNQNYITALQKMEQLSKIKEQEPKVKIEETEELQNTLQETIKKIIEKAKNTKTIVEVTKNDDYEYEIWKNILQLRVIKLEDISLKITKDKEKYFMQIFDEGAFEEKTQIFISTTINEKQIKINKKIKIFE